MTFTRYEVETRWRENGMMLAWGYVAEFSKKLSAEATRDRLLETPRKVSDFRCRVIEVVRSNQNGRVLARNVISPEKQLELPLEI